MRGVKSVAFARRGVLNVTSVGSVSPSAGSKEEIKLVDFGVWRGKGPGVLHSLGGGPGKCLCDTMIWGKRANERYS